MALVIRSLEGEIVHQYRELARREQLTFTINLGNIQEAWTELLDVVGTYAADTYEEVENALIRAERHSARKKRPVNA